MKYEPYAIAIDPGKRLSKCEGRKMTEGQIVKHSFPTKLYALSKGDAEVEGNTHKINFDGTDYLIGDQGTDSDHDNSKATLLHQLAVYTGICLIAGEDTHPKVILTIGCPTSTFKNKKLKEEYRRLIFNEGEVEFRVDGKTYNIRLLKVLVRRESSGIVYAKPDLFKSKTVGILDLGGKNFNYSNYVNLVCRPTNQFSNNLGSEYLETRIQAALTEYLGEDVPMDIAKEAIRNGGLAVRGEFDKETALIVHREKEAFVLEVIGRLKSANVNITVQEFIATGGLFKNVIDQFKEHIPHIQVPDLDYQWCNADGFQVVSEVKYHEITKECNL